MTFGEATDMTDHDEAGPTDEADGQDERDDRRHFRGGPSRLELLANLLAIIVGLAAIGLAVWQGFENRQFYRLSVLPRLEPVEASWNSARPITSEYFLLPEGSDSLYAVGYSVENTGLGPAVLRNFLVYREGRTVFDAAESGERYAFAEVKEDLNELPFESLKLNLGYSAGQLLAEDEVHHLMTVGVRIRAGGKVDEATVDRSIPGVIIEDVLGTYSFVFCYCSVYETDCDMTYLGSEPPARACRT